MKTKITEFEVLIPNVDGTDIAERVKVPVTLEWDEEVKQWLLTPEAHQIIEDTKARRIGLLLPAQLKELRERYDYTQKVMGELFQVGEKSWTRWESGKHRPSRSINLLIRALYEGEISISFLLKRAGKPLREESEKTLNAEFVRAVISHLNKSAASSTLYATCNFQIELPSGGQAKSDSTHRWNCLLIQQLLRTTRASVWSTPRANMPVGGPVPRFDASKFGMPTPSAS